VTTTLSDIELEAPAIAVGGKLYMRDAKGALVPQESVKAQHLLEDEMVRKVVSYAQPLAEQVARFREHTFDDVDAFVAMMEQQYAARRGGMKGNITLMSFDGTLKVQVKVADNISFGPELQIAKALLDEYLIKLASDADADLRTIVNYAFDVDSSNTINRGRLLGLLRYDIKNEQWLRAMEAIRDSIRVIGSKRYVNIYRRDRADGPWRHVAIDVASA